MRETAVSVVVGGQGQGSVQLPASGYYHAGGGVGGTFIFISEAPDCPILVGGGAGGAGSATNQNTPGTVGQPGSTTTSSTLR